MYIVIIAGSSIIKKSPLLSFQPRESSQFRQQTMLKHASKFSSSYGGKESKSRQGLVGSSRSAVNNFQVLIS